MRVWESDRLHTHVEGGRVRLPQHVPKFRRPRDERRYWARADTITGRMRLRCFCGKVPSGSEAEARELAAGVHAHNDREMPPLRFYQCQAGMWHWTRLNPDCAPTPPAATSEGTPSPVPTTRTTRRTINVIVPNGYPGDPRPFTDTDVASLPGQTVKLTTGPDLAATRVGSARITTATLDGDRNLRLVLDADVLPDWVPEGDPAPMSLGLYRRGEQVRAFTVWPVPADAPEFTLPREEPPHVP